LSINRSTLSATDRTDVVALFIADVMKDRFAALA